MSVPCNYLTFSLGDFYFGIIASDVVELNKNLNVTLVPKSKKVFKGITNLRGQIVPVIDMYERLGLINTTKTKQTISIVSRCHGLVIALLVDSVGEILELEANTFEPPPNNFSQETRELILGVHTLPGQLLLIIDAQKVINGTGEHRDRPFEKEIIKGIDIHRGQQLLN